MLLANDRQAVIALVWCQKGMTLTACITRQTEFVNEYHDCYVLNLSSRLMPLTLMLNSAVIWPFVGLKRLRIEV